MGLQISRRRSHETTEASGIPRFAFFACGLWAGWRSDSRCVGTNRGKKFGHWGGSATVQPPVHAIYSNGHFVQFTAPANRPKSQKAIPDMTREELVERLQGMQGQYGTYRVEGNKLIRTVLTAANPNNEGTENTSEFRLEGDTLILKNTNPQGQPSEIRYRRLR